MDETNNHLMDIKALLTQIELNTRPKVKAQRVSKNFQKPTIEEVTTYIQERNNNIDPESFYHYYEANNWCMGKTKIKNWKACIITWEKRNKPNQRVIEKI